MSKHRELVDIAGEKRGETDKAIRLFDGYNRMAPQKSGRGQRRRHLHDAGMAGVGARFYMTDTQALEDRIVELEHVLGITAAIPPYLLTGLDRSKRIVLGLVLTRTFVTPEAINIATRRSPADDGRLLAANLASVHISYVRKYLRKSHRVTVHTVWGEGWYIEPADQKRVLARLQAEAA